MLGRALRVKIMESGELEALHAHEIKVLDDYRVTTGNSCSPTLGPDQIDDWLENYRGRRVRVMEIDPENRGRMKRYMAEQGEKPWEDADEKPAPDKYKRDQTRIHRLDWVVFHDKSFPIYERLRISEKSAPMDFKTRAGGD